MELRAGVEVRGGLRLVRELGSGAMGSVWTATHEQLGTEVAVKFIRRDLDRDGNVVRRRLEREAKAAAQIQSPHAVKVLDAGVMPGVGPFIVMERLEGDTLGAYLARHRRLSLRDTAEVVAQVAHALEEAHRRGIIHRDIKPDNIFLVQGSDRVYAKVLDFGLAKSDRWSGSGKLTNPSEMVGTPAYLSRETILALPVDRQVDLWALAVVAYECLTGALPFDGASMALICVAICDGNYAPARALTPSLPPRVDAFFARALASEPSQRFPTAEALAAGLIACASPTSSDRDDAVQAFQQSGPFALPSSLGTVADGAGGEDTSLSHEVVGSRGRARGAVSRSGRLLGGVTLLAAIAVGVAAVGGLAVVGRTDAAKTDRGATGIVPATPEDADRPPERQDTNAAAGDPAPRAGGATVVDALGGPSAPPSTTPARRPSPSSLVTAPATPPTVDATASSSAAGSGSASAPAPAPETRRSSRRTPTSSGRKGAATRDEAEGILGF
ncbi:MAG: serine/threonine-protein kinase [Myxococcota bacterium]